MRFLMLGFTALLLTACGQLLMPEVEQELGDIKPGNYRLDPDHTAVLFKVEHMGISTFVGRFNDVEASLNYDSERPESSQLEARVEMASLDIDQPDLAETLRSCQWLCVEDYPQAHFVTTGSATVEGNQLVFPGDLTFRGETRPIDVTVTVNGGADSWLTESYTLGFDAELEFLRSDFGMGRFVPTVGDKIRVEVYTEFKRR